MAKPWLHFCKNCGVPISMKFKFCYKHNEKKYSKLDGTSDDIYYKDKYTFKYKESYPNNKFERGCNLNE